MNKTIGTLITATFLLTLTVGCTGKTIATNTTAPTQVVATTQTHTTAPATQISTANSNRFRVTHPERVGSVDVVCHNCRAHFKLSQQIQKMSMKGDAIIPCPVCHKNYLGK